MEIERELAKRRMSMGGSGIKVRPNGLTCEGQSRDIVAKTIGVSPKTFERAKKIIQNK